MTNDKIKNIESYDINLIIDFLKFIWDTGSNIIHINNENIQIQKEILYEYLGKSKDTKKDLKGEISFDIKEIISIIFEDNQRKYSQEKTCVENDSNLIKTFKTIIQEEKNKNLDSSQEKFIDLDVSNNNNLTESQELDITNSNNELTVEKLKNILSGEAGKNINLFSQLDLLLKKLKLNDEISKTNSLDELEEINGLFLYNLWRNSFITDIWKSKKAFTKYNKVEKITSLKTMGLNICKLLEGFQINIFVDDPKGIDMILKNCKNKNA